MIYSNILKDKPIISNIDIYYGYLLFTNNKNIFNRTN